MFGGGQCVEEGNKEGSMLSTIVQRNSVFGGRNIAEGGCLMKGL